MLEWHVLTAAKRYTHWGVKAFSPISVTAEIYDIVTSTSPAQWMQMMTQSGVIQFFNDHYVLIFDTSLDYNFSSHVKFEDVENCLMSVLKLKADTLIYSTCP